MSNPPIVITDAMISESRSKMNVLEAMRVLFTQLGNGQAVQPPQTLTEFPTGGDFITYMGALADSSVFGAKLSPYLPREGGPIITAWTMLMSMESGQPLALVDAGRLTTERTAATTALAVDELAPRGKALSLAIIGSGAVAQAHMRHVTGLRDWAEVRVFSPNLASNTATQESWRALQSDAVFVGSAKEAVTAADVVMLCTSSGTPVIEQADLSPQALVTSISTNVARAHEIDPAFLTKAQVYCDYRATTPGSAGDMLIAAETHGWSADQIAGDLGGLCTDQCPRPDGARPVYFRSIGLGLEDIAVAKAVYDSQTS